MNPIPIIGVGIVTAVLSLILKDKKKEYSFILSIVGSVIIVSAAIVLIIPVITSAEEFLNETDAENIKVVLKALGIGYLASFAADACRDAGEPSLASKIELYGKAAVVAVSFPLLKSLFETAKGLLQ